MESPNPDPVAIPTQPTSRLKQLAIRISVAVGVGILVSGLSLYVAWGNANGTNVARFEQYVTQERLKAMAVALARYRSQFHTEPGKMDDLTAVLSKDTLSFDSYSSFIDGWNRKLILTNDGTHTFVISYGRDDKTGGRGLDCDLTSNDWKPKAAIPTFRQFLFDMPTGGMIKSCFICGGLAALLAAVTIKFPGVGNRKIGPLLVRLGSIVLGAVIVGIIISALHAPMGH